MKQRKFTYRLKNKPIIKSSSFSAFNLKKNVNKNRNKKNKFRFSKKLYSFR